MPVQRTVSPIDGRLVAERELADAAAVASALERAGAAFPRWRATPVVERCALLSRAIDALVARRDAIAREITLQRAGREPQPLPPLGAATEPA